VSPGIAQGDTTEKYCFSVVRRILVQVLIQDLNREIDDTDDVLVSGYDNKSYGNKPSTSSFIDGYDEVDSSALTCPENSNGINRIACDYC
jgi:hypothetical protein